MAYENVGMTNSYTENEAASKCANTPTNDMVMTDMDVKPKSLYTECSMARLDDTYKTLERNALKQETEQVYMNTDNNSGRTTSKTLQKQKQRSYYKPLACILTPIAAMAITTLLCIAYFFH